MTGFIQVKSLETGVSSVMLDRADRRNALGIELLEQLCEAIARLARDTAQRLVIVRAAGPVFSAGLDLREAADNSLIERSADALQRTLSLLRETPLVTVAAVQGGAYAGGAGVMAACDIVIAAENAKIGFPEARRGLVPALILGVLAGKLRDGDLRDVLLTGDAIDARRAQQLGLVQRVVPADSLLDEALRVARSVLAGGPETIRHTKALLNEPLHPRDKQAPAHLRERHLAARHGDEVREGLAAFLEKREANWSVN
jgi:methylglutaconyl-CoA hydratase